MSKYDKLLWAKVKADPERHAAYLERKRRERKARPDYERERKRKWRLANPEAAMRIRRANHAVELAIKAGTLLRRSDCSSCGATKNIQAHHHKGYAEEFWLDVVWLCVNCHAKEHRRIQ